MSEEVAPRPRPIPSRLTEEFWAAARRHQLVRPRCEACGRSFFVPQAVCTHCLSENWRYEPSSGRGTVRSATISHRPPFPGIEAPYQLAVIELEEGWTMLSNIVDTVEAAPIGAPVKVTWLDVDDELTLPMFTLEESGA